MAVEFGSSIKCKPTVRPIYRNFEYVKDRLSCPVLACLWSSKTQLKCYITSLHSCGAVFYLVYPSSRLIPSWPPVTAPPAAVLLLWQFAHWFIGSGPVLQKTTQSFAVLIHSPQHRAGSGCFDFERTRKAVVISRVWVRVTSRDICRSRFISGSTRVIVVDLLNKQQW